MNCTEFSNLLDAFMDGALSEEEARRMREHGCSTESVQKVKEEAFALHMTGYPERLIDCSVRWEYAFKI